MSDSLELATRALKHFNEGTTDLAPSQMRIPLTAYTDEEQYRAERRAVFFESPIAVALSLEVPEPGDFQTQMVMDIPLLITRDRDGLVHCFINVCRHRGAKVCQAGKGHQSRFSCPYHAWTYNNRGELVGIYGEETFGDVDRDSMGLTELACDESAGVIFVCLTPGKTFELSEWLGEFADKLADQALHDWHLYTERYLSGAGGGDPRWLPGDLPPRQRTWQNRGSTHGWQPAGSRYLGRASANGDCPKKHWRAQRVVARELDGTRGLYPRGALGISEFVYFRDSWRSVSDRIHFSGRDQHHHRDPPAHPECEGAGDRPRSGRSRNL